LGGFRGLRGDSVMRSLRAYSHTPTQTIVLVCGITRSRYLLGGSRGALQRRNACVGLVYLRIPSHLNSRRQSDRRRHRRRSATDNSRCPFARFREQYTLLSCFKTLQIIYVYDACNVHFFISIISFKKLATIIKLTIVKKLKF